MALRFGIPGSRQRVIGGISSVPGALGIIPNSEIWYYPDLNMSLQFVEPSLNGRYTLGYDVKYTTARARPDAPIVSSLQIPAGAPLPGAFHSFALTDPMKKAHDRGLMAAEEVAVSYGYCPPAEPLPLFYEVVAARGADGLTDIAVNSGVPVSELRTGATASPYRGSVIKRIRILTDDYEVLASEQRVAVFTVHDTSAADPLELVTDEWRIDALPDTYIVEVAVEDTLTGRSGSGRSLVVVPDCAGPGLGMSDLMIAYSVERGSRFVRLGGSVVPRPSSR
jgi:hypothetical protein